MSQIDPTSSQPHVSTELSRDLTLFHLVMMGLGMMIGAGVFLGIGISLHESGPGGLLMTFAFNGLVAVLTAMSFAELSSAIPRAGGVTNYARIGFGRGASFMAGWMEWFASSVAGAMYAITFALFTVRYAKGLGWLDWLPLDPDAVPTNLQSDYYVMLVVKALALITAAFFIYINYRGASETGKLGALITVGQMTFMVVIALAGAVTILRDPSRLQNFQPFVPQGWGKVLATMGFTYVAFEGYEVIAQAGDEAIDPKRNLPKAMLYSVLAVTLTYVTVATATVVSIKSAPGDVAVAPWQYLGNFEEEAFGVAVQALMPYGSFLVTLAVMFSATSALNATVYSATRASYALGRDRLLPAVFSRISSTTRTPYVALAATSIIVVLVAALLPVKHVASSASIMFLFLFLLVNLCVIRIRRRMGDELQYGFLMPFFPYLPILAILCQIAMAVHLVELSWLAWVVAPAWIAVGGLLYVVYSRHHAIATSDEVHVLEEEKDQGPEDYRIMVAVANPANAIEMVRTTYHLSVAKNAHVELLHMVPMPDQVPLEDAHNYSQQGREGIVEAMLYLAPMFPVSTTIRYCRNPARGIVSAAREKKTHMLVMGWHGEAREGLFKLGSTVDPIIEQSPCNVIVLKNCGGNRKFKRILVPLAGGPNAAFALEVATIIADPDEGQVTAFTVANEQTQLDVANFLIGQRHRLHLPPERIRALTAQSDDVGKAILTEAQNYDMVVLGCTQTPLLRRIWHETLPETIARTCDKPLVMVKASTPLRSWIQRWL